MNVITKSSVSPPIPQASATNTTEVLPDIEIRFSPLYAWLLIGFGGIFLIFGLLLATSPVGRQSDGLGLLICVLSIAGVFGANYWRHHLPIIVRMTQRRLFLPRGVEVDWADIVEIEKKTLALSRHGARNTSEFVCFKLKNQPAKYNRVNQAFLKLIKSALLGGYDVVINPQDELFRSADWFLAECKKRMDSSSSIQRD
jgi:hypothetical protein